MPTSELCCEMMKAQVTFTCDQHVDARACPDKVLDYIPKFNEFGLLIHSGADGYASSSITIRHCPWCGSDLGRSYREAWFDELEARGLEPEDELPEELTDATWWRRRGLPSRP